MAGKCISTAANGTSAAARSAALVWSAGSPPAPRRSKAVSRARTACQVGRAVAMKPLSVGWSKTPAGKPGTPSSKPADDSTERSVLGQVDGVVKGS